MNMTRTLGWLLAAALLAVVPAQAAKLYKWVDKDGRVSYHDQPPPSEDVRVEEKDFRTGERSTGAQAGKELPAVVLYAAPRCESCELARNYLKKRNVPFTEKNAESDVKVQQELKAKSGTLSVPTITVGEKVMRGYMESLLEGELDAAGFPKAEPEAKAEEGKPAAQ
jgi:glutaredoxin